MEKYNNRKCFLKAIEVNKRYSNGYCSLGANLKDGEYINIDEYKFDNKKCIV